ncbi:hypothetical protein REPUB_Repub05bG0046800 [Reevesia pubescens]
MVENVNYYNSYLNDVVFRGSDNDLDVRNHVFRWDTTHFQQIFQNGFEARFQQGTSDDEYYNLDQFVHHGGRPLDSNRPTTRVFVSTTLDSSWHPTIEPGTQIELYRYEVYAPGGVLVASTFGDQYLFPAQDEVTFVSGIASQFIRSAQLFRLETDAGSSHGSQNRDFK